MANWIDANGGFFKTFKKITFNEGATGRAATRAARNENKRAGARVMQNVKEGEDALSTLRNVRKDARTASATYGIGNEDIKKVDTIAGNLHADGKNINTATADELEKVSNAYDKRIKRGTKIEAVKGYWSDPYRNLKSGDKNTRDLAMGQLIGRTGMVAGGTTLGVGLTHDLFASKENDTGFGGIVSNTLATTALSSAAATGVSLLRKL